MALSRIIEKLDSYYGRLKSGKAGKIKPDHVRKALDKLRKREKRLEAEISDAKKDEKKASLKRKLRVTREQIQRARWLLDKIKGEKG